MFIISNHETIGYSRWAFSRLFVTYSTERIGGSFISGEQGRSGKSQPGDMSDKNSLDLSDDEEDVEVGAMNANVAQEISGTLSKWTNYIHGWQDRYIVVKDGVMAYYKSQQDTGYGCRGSVSIRQASIKVCFSVALLFLAIMLLVYLIMYVMLMQALVNFFALPC